MLALLILPSSPPLALCLVYGFPGSHVRHADNEAMLSQALACLAKLKLPALLMGDLNETLAGSRTLNHAYRVGFWKINSNEPTTMDKRGHVAQGEAIDHVLANHRCKDYGPSAQVSYERWISDHFPIFCKLKVPNHTMPCWILPQPMKIESKVLPTPDWSEKSPENFLAWNQRAVHWVSQAHGVKPQPRGTLTSHPPGRFKCTRITSTILRLQCRSSLRT